MLLFRVFTNTSERIAVFLADTWLHITTKTVEFVQISPVTAVSNYSFTLLPDCTITNNSVSQNRPGPDGKWCAMIISGQGIVFFTNSTQSLQVLNNISEVTTVLTYQSKIPYTYLGIPEAQVLQLDYTATTFGMQTQCKLVSNECNLNGDYGAFTSFYCAETFQGDLTQGPSWQTAYFTDSAMTSNDTFWGVHNPYYFSLASREGNGITDGGPNSSELVGVLHGGYAFILFCSAALYDIEYDSINGTITRFVTTASNDSVANVWQSTISTITGDPSVSTLQQASTLAMFSDTTQELEDMMALAYSRTALALGAQAVMRSPALAAQERQSFLVTSVEAAPLFTLVIANLLFVFLGIVLTGIAIKASRGDVREVQARLSIIGLVADRFEGQRGRDGVEKMDDYFEEKDGNGSVRVAIDRSDGGGFAYKVWPKAGH
jgi:hypothetical protein